MNLLSWLFVLLYLVGYLLMFLFPIMIIVICSMWWAKLGRRR